MHKSLILCIDDEALGLQIRRIVLERAGYCVKTATDGPSGLKAFLDERVDAVILDYFMPGMDGGAVALELRRLRPQVPILLLSAYINLPVEITRIVNCTVLKGDGAEILLARLSELLSPEAAG